jgi:dimethylargininase
LKGMRLLHAIEAPGTLDGGDVLRIGSTVFVGVGGRTNAAGFRQLEMLLRRSGYSAQAVPNKGCLHLKTAATQVAEQTVLLNPAWVDPVWFEGLNVVRVHPDEPFAGNALMVGDHVLHPSPYPETRSRLERAGIKVRTLEAGELVKAEAGLTCCSLIVR